MEVGDFSAEAVTHSSEFFEVGCHPDSHTQTHPPQQEETHLPVPDKVAITRCHTTSAQREHQQHFQT